jgi:hypothetical protein
VAKHRADRATAVRATAVRATKGRHRAPARNRVSTVGTVIRTMGVVAALGFSAPVVLDQAGHDDTVVSEYRGASGVESSGTWEVEYPGTGDASASVLGTRIGQ